MIGKLYEMGIDLTKVSQDNHFAAIERCTQWALNPGYLNVEYALEV